MKILIVDDEPLAQARLTRLLAAYPQVTICGYAQSGEHALEQVASTNPDVVFLDIQMAGMDGLTTAQHLSQLTPPPAVVFLTAHPEHALDAFAVMPTAYLLKPLEEQGLASLMAKLGTLTRAHLQKQQSQQLSYRLGGKLKQLPLDDVLYISRDGKYSQVVSLHNKELANVLVDDSLKQLEQTYANHLIRIHRNTLINKNKISALQQAAQGYEVFLTHLNQPLAVSRREVSKLKALLG